MVLQIVDIAKEILKLQQDISAVLLGEEHEDQSWFRKDSNVQTQSHNCYTETDSRDWHSRSQTSPVASEEKSWDKIREAKESRVSSGKQEQLSSQFAAKAQTGPTPTLVKAEVPWSVRRGNLSEKEKVLKAVKGYYLISELFFLLVLLPLATIFLSIILYFGSQLFCFLLNCICSLPEY